VVVKTDPERGLVMVRGAVPGSKGGWVLVRDAVLKKAPKDLPRPGAIRGGGSEAAEPKEQA
jgi:large subunit ribosomal protein L3